MNRPTQIASAFLFGFIILTVMLGIAILYPYPSSFQLFVFRVVLALAAGGVAAMLPGFLTITLPPFLRAGGAIAVFAVIYFYNPATLTAKGIETSAQDVFETPIRDEEAFVEYYWKHAEIKFHFPRDGWGITVDSISPSTGIMTLEHFDDKDEQIQILVGSLYEVPRDRIERLELREVDSWKSTVPLYFPRRIEEVILGDRAATRTRGLVRDDKYGLKFVDRVETFLDDNRRFEMHLTTGPENIDGSTRNDAYELILSTIRFDR